MKKTEKAITVGIFAVIVAFIATTVRTVIRTAHLAGYFMKSVRN